MAFEKLEKENQSKIINAAYEVFAKYGYKKASMKDISAAAGVSKSVLFKYFSSKDNLYLKLFRLASDSICEADDAARAAKGDRDLFSLMRRSVKTRLALFKEYPWIFRFSYTAVFDTDLFVKDLVKKELDLYRDQQTKKRDNLWAQGGVFSGFDEYRGLRGDVPPEMVKQMVLWISKGYLEEQLYSGDIKPDQIKQGYEKWIDLMELLLKDRSSDFDKTSGRTGDSNE